MQEARRFLADDELIHVVIHHSPCDDGHAAAALFYEYDSSIRLIGVHPKDDLLALEGLRETITGKNVIFVDIAFSAEVMTAVAALAHKVVVLDHHVTNQNTLENLHIYNLRAVFLMDIAGVRLAWRFLYGDDERDMPKALYYIALKDVWQHEHIPEAFYFASAFTRPTTWDDWLSYINDEERTERTVQLGHVIHSYQQSVLNTMMEKVEYLSWRGYRIAIVNVPYPWISDMGALMCQTEPERTIAVIWNKSVKGPYSVSLRSHNTLGPNVEQIAVEFKGGGHAHAAGIRLDRPPYEVFNSDIGKE
jgi:nanoRNase/pAp phosphatase (c-di-AMP/oligoRNAs hydrolase)